MFLLLNFQFSKIQIMIILLNIIDDFRNLKLNNCFYNFNLCAH